MRLPVVQWCHTAIIIQLFQLNSSTNLIKLWNHPVKSNWILLYRDPETNTWNFLSSTKNQFFCKLNYLSVGTLSVRNIFWLKFIFRQNSSNGPMWVTGSHPGEPEMFISDALQMVFSLHFRIIQETMFSGHSWAFVSSWHRPLGSGQQWDDGREARLRPHQEYSCCVQVIRKTSQHIALFVAKTRWKLFSNSCYWLQLNMQIVNHHWYTSGKQHLSKWWNDWNVLPKSC